jgi:hypothetical protein
VIHADEIRIGDLIIPAGRKRPIEVIDLWPSARTLDHIELAYTSSQGSSTLLLQQDESVQLVRRGD